MLKREIDWLFQFRWTQSHNQFSHALIVQARAFWACVCMRVFVWNRFLNSLFFSLFFSPCDWRDAHKNSISKFRLIFRFNSFLAFLHGVGISISCTRACKINLPRISPPTFKKILSITTSNKKHHKSNDFNYWFGWLILSWAYNRLWNLFTRILITLQTIDNNKKSRQCMCQCQGILLHMSWSWSTCSSSKIIFTQKSRKTCLRLYIWVRNGAILETMLKWSVAISLTSANKIM